MSLTELGIKAAKAQDKPYKLYHEKGLFISHADRRSTVALQVQPLGRGEAPRCDEHYRRGRQQSR
jgi:hypothetical protein